MTWLPDAMVTGTAGLPTDQLGLAVYPLNSLGGPPLAVEIASVASGTLSVSASFFQIVNPSIGSLGQTAPLSGNLAGFVDPSGNLAPGHVTAFGDLRITGSVGITSGLVSSVQSSAPTVFSASVGSELLYYQNLSRKGMIITNNSPSVMFLGMFSGVSTASYTVPLYERDSYEFPQPIYTGPISAIWQYGSGSAIGTEFS